MVLRIISPDGTLFEGEVTKVTLPGAMGLFTVLDNHAPLLSTLRAGEMLYETREKEERKMTIEGGIVDVKANIVSVCI